MSKSLRKPTPLGGNMGAKKNAKSSQRSSTTGSKPTTKKKSSRSPPTLPQPQRLQIYSGPMGQWTTATTTEITQERIENEFFSLFKLSQHSSSQGERNGVRGLFATKDIEPGDIITAIPSEAAITESLARHSVIGQCLQSILLSSTSSSIGTNIQSPHKSAFFDEFGGVILTPGHVILFTYLIFLRFTTNPTHITTPKDLESYLSLSAIDQTNYQSQHSNEFQPDNENYHRVYARWLPTEYTIPLCWTHEMMQQTGFTNTDMYKSTLSRMKHLEMTYNSIFPALFKTFPAIFNPVVYTFERFIWAYCAYTSRSFPSHFLQHFDIVEGLHHLNQQVLYPELYSKVDIVIQSQSLKGQGNKTKQDSEMVVHKDISLCGVMLPYLDLTNHTNNHEIHWLSGPHSNSTMTPSLLNNNNLDGKIKTGSKPRKATDVKVNNYSVDQLGRLIITPTQPTIQNNSTLATILQSNPNLNEYLIDKITIHNNSDERAIHPTIISPNFTHSFFPPSSTNLTSPSQSQRDLYHTTFYPQYQAKAINISLGGSVSVLMGVELNTNGTCKGDYISYQACLEYKVGDEIHNNYGPKTQDELLFGYGFILEEFKKDITTSTTSKTTKNQKNTTSSLIFSPNNAVFVQLPKPTPNNPIAQQQLIFQHIKHISTTLTNPMQKKMYLQNPFLYELTPHGLPAGMSTMMSLFSMSNIDVDNMVQYLDEEMLTNGNNSTLNFSTIMSPSLRQRGLIFVLQQLLNKLSAINPLVSVLNNPQFTKMIEGIIKVFVPTMINDPFSIKAFPLFSSALPQLYQQYRILSLYFILRLVYLCPFASPSCYYQDMVNVSNVNHIALSCGITAALNYQSSVDSTESSKIIPGSQRVNSALNPITPWDYPQYCMIIHLVTQNHIRFIAIEHTLVLLRRSATPLIPPTITSLQVSKPLLNKPHPRFETWKTSGPDGIIRNMMYGTDEMWYPLQTPSSSSSSPSTLLCHIPHHYLLSVFDLIKVDIHNQSTHKERTLPPLNLVAQTIRHYLQSFLGGVDFYIEISLLLLYIRRMVSDTFAPDGLTRVDQYDTLTSYEYEIIKAWKMICCDNFNYLPSTKTALSIDPEAKSSLFDQIESVSTPKTILQQYQYLNTSPLYTESFSACSCVGHGEEVQETLDHDTTMSDDTTFFSIPNLTTSLKKCQNCKQCCKSTPVIGMNPINSETEIVSMAKDIIIKTINAVQSYFSSPSSPPPTLPQLSQFYPEGDMALLFGNPDQITEDLLTAFHLIHQLKVSGGNDLKLVPLPFQLSRQLSSPKSQVGCVQNNYTAAYSIVQSNGFSIFSLTPSDSINNNYPILLPLDTPLEPISQQVITKEDAGVVDSTTFFIPSRITTLNQQTIFTTKQRDMYDFVSSWAQRYPLFHQQHVIEKNKMGEKDEMVKNLTEFLDAGHIEIDFNTTSLPEGEEEPLIVTAPRVGDPSDDVLRFDLGIYRGMIREWYSNNHQNNNTTSSLHLTLKNSTRNLAIPRLSTSNTYSFCTKWFIRALFGLANPFKTGDENGENDENDENDDSATLSIIPRYITEWLGGYDIETIINTISTSIPCFTQPFISTPVHKGLFALKTTSETDVQTTLIPDQLLLCCLNLLRVAAQVVDGEEDVDFGFDFGNDDEDDEDGDDDDEKDKKDDSKSLKQSKTTTNSTQSLLKALLQNQKDIVSDMDVNHPNKCLPKLLNEVELTKFVEKNAQNPSNLNKLFKIHQEICQIHRGINEIVENNTKTIGNKDVIGQRNEIIQFKCIETIRWKAIINTLFSSRLHSHVNTLINLLRQYNTMNNFMYSLPSQGMNEQGGDTDIQQVFNNFISSHLIPSEGNGLIDHHELTPAILYHLISINSLDTMLNCE